MSPETSSVPTHAASLSNAGRRSPSPFVFVSTESSDAVTSQKCTCPSVCFPSQSPPPSLQRDHHRQLLLAALPRDDAKHLAHVLQRPHRLPSDLLLLPRVEREAS